MNCNRYLQIGTDISERQSLSLTLHPVFRSSFLILSPIIGIHGSLTMLLSVFSDLGTWCLFSRIIEHK